jgi:hypothetical protein
MIAARMTGLTGIESRPHAAARATSPRRPTSILGGVVPRQGFIVNKTITRRAGAGIGTARWKGHTLRHVRWPRHVAEVGKQLRARLEATASGSGGDLSAELTLRGRPRPAAVARLARMVRSPMLGRLTARRSISMDTVGRVDTIGRHTRDGIEYVLISGLGTTRGQVEVDAGAAGVRPLVLRRELRARCGITRRRRGLPSHPPAHCPLLGHDAGRHGSGTLRSGDGRGTARASPGTNPLADIA